MQTSDDFERGEIFRKISHFVTFTNFSDDINGSVAFGPTNLDNTVGEVISAKWIEFNYALLKRKNILMSLSL